MSCRRSRPCLRNCKTRELARCYHQSTIPWLCRIDPRIDPRGGESIMISRRLMLLTTAAAVLAAGHLPASAAPRAANPIAMFDTDNDGTLDLMEAKKAASALFAKLDHDHDGTVDKRELAGRLSAKELASADPDHDGTLTLDEYLVVVEQRFKAADPDSDGTLDAKELSSKAGQALLRLMKEIGAVRPTSGRNREDFPFASRMGGRLLR